MAPKAKKDPRAVALEKALGSLPGSVYSEHDVSKFARSINLTRQSVDRWKICPPKHVIALEKASGVSRHELRPDIYPVED